LSELRTGTGRKAEISRDDLKELMEEFPEFGERALTGLNRAFSKLSLGGGGLTAEQAEEIWAKKETERKNQEEQAAEAEGQKQIHRLTKQHPDWVDVVGLKDPVTLQFPDTAYRRWLKLQDEDYQEDIRDSRDARQIAESITKFKDYVAAQSKPSEQKPKLPSGQTEREKELKRAIQPKGAGGGSTTAGPMSEDEAMEIGLKA
jgi:hypothetical protein